MSARARWVGVAAVLWLIAIAAGGYRLDISVSALILIAMAVAAAAMAGLVIATVRLNRTQHRTGLARHAEIEAAGGYEALVERSAAETARTTV